MKFSVADPENNKAEGYNKRNGIAKNSRCKHGHFFEHAFGFMIKITDHELSVQMVKFKKVAKLTHNKYGTKSHVAVLETA